MIKIYLISIIMKLLYICYVFIHPLLVYSNHWNCTLPQKSNTYNQENRTKYNRIAEWKTQKCYLIINTTFHIIFIVTCQCTNILIICKHEKNKKQIYTMYIWDHFCEKGPNAYFFKISIFQYSRSLKCLLHIAFYAMRIGVSVMEL